MSLDSRPLTPDSRLASSLHRATATIDDLTHTLSSVSRLSSPEPENASTCCCGREDCETSQAWTAFKAKLESRLVLSAGMYWGQVRTLYPLMASRLKRSGGRC